MSLDKRGGFEELALVFHVLRALISHWPIASHVYVSVTVNNPISARLMGVGLRVGTEHVVGDVWLRTPVTARLVWSTHRAAL
jgi:hypothetical protein